MADQACFQVIKPASNERRRVQCPESVLGDADEVAYNAGLGQTSKR
jgi:hypothetical protein